MERVSNEPFREAFLRSDLSLSDVAKHMQWFRLKKNRRGEYTAQPDVTTAARRLGLKATKSKGFTTLTRTIREDEALKMLPLFPSLDPVDVDI